MPADRRHSPRHLRNPRPARLGSARLGSGGIGEVYRARDTRLGRDVAIKVLPENVASSPERLARLYSIEEAGGTRFLTMELVEGRDLTSLFPKSQVT